YIALDPIYPTILKQMKWSQQGPERLRIWKERIGSLALVAIGGLNVDRIETVFAHGADCAAVVTDITLSADPEARTRQWLHATAARRTVFT
ncbi:thiamine phosphate synthase, partial [Pseudomonas syringae group genomosp. 7]|uniref:thiamine phosphate synthase n=1 Tax=Pseudomonas syringae group genomosp. 7 TaxID=251699 RepID=UPI0037703868